jgi:Raf kinase inhibitor-like YbhB/YbcL family protein
MARTTTSSTRITARILPVAALATVAGLAGPLGCGGSSETKPPAAPAEIRLTSPAFADGATIPKQFTCDGDDVSPPLQWNSVPRGTVQLAVVVDDPDAPGGAFNHWTMWFPPVKSLTTGAVPTGARQARNSNGDDHYTGPCPPSGENPHHYEFIIYALKRPIKLGNGVTARTVLAAIRRDAIAEGRLTGTYGR